MATTQILPCGGINNVSIDSALQTQDTTYVQDAVNVDVLPSGDILLRNSGSRVTETPYSFIWQSPLHGDVFGLHGADWVKINTVDWTHEVLASNVGTAPLYHSVINNKVVVATGSYIYVYDGSRAQRLSIDTPPMPIVTVIDGSLPAGNYQVAIAYMRGDVESAVSEIAFTELSKNGGLSITWSFSLYSSVTGVRIYLSHDEGVDLQLVETLPLELYSYDVAAPPNLGRVPQFKNLSPMPTGKYLSVWQGRLWQASANIIRFSQALAYHLHDERHDFIQMPQAITFLEPVDGGIWVGQRDHVAFLQGTNPSEFVLIRKTQQAPIEGSAVRMAIETSEQIVGAQMVVWLSSVGYVAGMPDGAIAPYQSKNLKDISAKLGNSVRFNKRIITTVS